MRKLIALALALCLIPVAGFAAIDDSATLESLKKKIDELSSELDEMSGRVNKTERHAALDRIHWSGDLRTKADTLHYQDVTWNPGIQVDFDDFAAKAMSGAFGSFADPNSPISQMMAANPTFAASFMSGSLQGTMPFALDRKTAVRHRQRHPLHHPPAPEHEGQGCRQCRLLRPLAMYKNWGDSTGVKVFDSWNAFTMDGTDSGNTTGDWLRVERAYFDWKDIGGSNFYLSIGRRPSTYGPPDQYRENELRGGTPSGHLVNFNFDGITAGYKLGEHTGIEGQIVRFCYGQGFESKVGNGELFNEHQPPRTPTSAASIST